MKSLDTPLQYLKGIGPKRSKLFQAAGVNTIEDLLYYFPRKYEDRRTVLAIAQLQEGQAAVIKAKILAKRARQSWHRRGFSVLELMVTDGSGKISVVWFNQGYLKDYFQVGQEIVLFGQVRRRDMFLQMVSPEFEVLGENSDSSLDIGRFVPVYPEVQGVSQRYMRRLVHRVLEEYVPLVHDILPFDIRSRHNLLNLAKSLLEIHFPQELDQQKEAYRRLSFEEFFVFIIPILTRKLSQQRKPGIAHAVEGDLVKQFFSSLPFALTAAQKRVMLEIRNDLAKPFAMQRLIQGDVGCGKTIVALYAAVAVIQGGYQVALMAPTEILARQHYEKISAVGASQQRRIKVGLLVSSLDKKEKEKIYGAIKAGKVDLIIGTHALLEETVQFKNLGLVVIDEQHKFGVSQRSLLPQKGNNPDVLIMTATPIPRTLAITLYGDLDISVIDELPPGRKAVETKWVKSSAMNTVYAFIRQRVAEGRQAYIVYPLVRESLVLDMRAAEEMYAHLKKKIFKGLSLGLVHGQMEQEKQDAVMQAFKQGKIDILISTTVLEVGIDVPNATVMVIEHAERFGLSSLHQLRGRIGRGSEQSYCVLVSSAETEDAKKRIAIMTETNDGFRIAEEDLKLRGPGEFFGDRQHGLSELRIANPLAQMQLLHSARQEAVIILQADPNLDARQNQLLRNAVRRRFPGYEKMKVVG